MPFTSIKDLVWYLLYMQSTKKNIKADKNEWVAVNKIPPTIALVSPQQKTRKIKFIS